MSFLIRRGQSVRWRMTMLSGEQPTNMAGGTWGVQETSFAQLPSFEQGETEAWLVWSSAQTSAMRVGTKRLRLKYTQANGDVKVFPDLRISVE
jgi:hypothetical protein